MALRNLQFRSSILSLSAIKIAESDMISLRGCKLRSETFTYITGQTKEDAIKFLNAFINNDSDYMEAKMK